MNDFDKALDDILLRHGAEQGELHYSLKQAIRQAVRDYVTSDITEAFTNKGTHPEYHDQQMRHLETHWPALYFAIRNIKETK